MFGYQRQDWTFAFRALRRTPRFTATAILILALGIGLATAMLSVFNAALLQRLPVRDQNRLVVLWPLGKGGTEFPLFAEEYDRLRANSNTLEAVAGFAHWGAVAAALRDGDRPLHLRQAEVSTNFFNVLGASPALGRLLQDRDRIDGNEPVVVISYGTWQRVYRGDPGVIGKQIEWVPVARKYTIVGVAPAGLDYPIGTEIWFPIWPSMPVDLVGRLKPGITPGAARAELATVVKQWQERTSNNSLSGGAFARELPAMIYGNVRPAVVVMTAAAALLLLIACTNVGNLLLLRAAGRSREVAIRRALGASRADIFRQLLAESALLGALGGVLGFGIATALLRVFVATAPADLPRMETIRLAGTPLAVALGVTLATVLLTGLAPLVSTGRRELDAPLLRQDGRSGVESRGRRRVRQLLVAGQVALALAVLAGASLLGRSLLRLETLSLGYGSEQLTILHVFPPADTSYVPWIRLLDRALPAIRSVPGVLGVTPVLAEPFTGSNTFTVGLEAEGRGSGAGDVSPIVSFEGVGADFSATFDLPLLRGAGFTGRERADDPPVALISKTIADWLWPGQDPIGRRVRFAGDTSARAWRTVVGVVGDIHYRDFRAATPTIFLEYHQLSFWQGTLGLRIRGEPAPVIEQIRAAIRSSAPELTFWQARPMSDIVAGPLARPRMDALLLGGFGFAALALAAIGLYAVIAWAVRQRTREIGIRMALGADRARIARAVLGEALGLVAAGGAVGLLIALAGSRLLTRVLFDTSPVDPVAILIAIAALLGAGLLAGWLPARQATAVDPVRALREE